MFLDYFALGILCIVFIVLFYGIIALRDIPYDISKDRNHPHQDAIRIAGWVSVFTFHVIWPFLWVWATLYREDSSWGGSTGKAGATNSRLEKKVADLTERLEALEGEGAVVGSVKTRPNTASFSTVSTERTNPPEDNSQKKEDRMVDGVVAGSLRVRPNTANFSNTRPLTAEDFLPKEADEADDKKKEKGDK